MDTILQTIVAVVIAVFASSGFWLFLDKRRSKTDAARLLLIGLARDRILTHSMKHIESGYITQEEYENLNDYLFKPYQSLGGDGTATRLMQEVNKLSIVQAKYTKDVSDKRKGEPDDVPK